ncbi:MAG TPA: Ig-like domain-containing protein [Longimicrobium sp.]
MSGTSGDITTKVGAAAKLGFVQQPSNTVAGASITPAVTVAIQDANGNTVTTATDNVTIAIGNNPASGTLSGTATVAAVNGIATFSDLSINKAGAGYTLAASSGSLTGATSGPFDITPGAPAALAFTVQPSNVVASAPITPAVQVSIVDANGNLVTTATDNVTIAIGTNPSGGTLSGTTTVAAVNGVATFSNLSINLVGTGYTLTASSGSLTGAMSSAFNVTHGPLHHFLVEAAGGGPIGPQLSGTPFNVKVTAQDEYNNTVTSFTGTVGFTSTPSGGITAGGTSGAFTAGVLTSHAITFGTPGSFTLTATRSSGGTESGTSNSFEVQAPPTAVNEGPAAGSAPGQPFHAFYSTAGNPQTYTLAAPGLLTNDNLGFPAATITSFGADSLGGSVTTYAAGTTVNPLPGTGRTTGSLSVGADGSVTFTPPDGFTGNYVFRYRLTNVRGTSDGIVTIAVGARPAAVNDTYSPVLLGNVPINTATSTQFRVTTNDAGDGKVLAITGQSNGTATLNADSTFTFRPNPGFEGSASFTYTVTNGFGTSAAATVSMTVANPVWFIDASASAGGDGRFDSRFSALSSFAAINNGSGNNPAANDRIFLYTGAYTAPVTLLNGQQFVGQGATGSSFSSVLGVTWPADSGPEPAINGTSPSITSATTGVTLGSGNTLRGFNLGNTTGAALIGSSFGTVVVTNVGINTTGQALNLTTGTLNGSFTQLRSTGGTNNVSLTGVATTGTSTLGGAGDVLSGATGDAFVVAGGTGSFTYSGNLTQASNAATVNVSGGHSGTLTFQTGTVSATNGTGLQFNNADGTYAFSGTTTLAGGNAGIDVSNGSSGTFTFPSTASITNPTAETVAISNSAPTFTYAGTLSKTNNSGSGITLSSNTGGTITFSGTSKVFSTGTSAAVNITGNGATILFTGGGLDIDVSGSNATGFTASGGGSVTVQGSNNVIDLTTGSNAAVALSVSGTTIAAGGLNFTRISANGGANGIFLNNTGSTAGLTVTGNGAAATPAGTGGTIQNTTGTDGSTSGIGIYLNNTVNPSFSWMQLNDHAGHAIKGSGLTNFTLVKTRITGTSGNNINGPYYEGAISLTDVVGAAAVTGSNISGGTLENIRFINTTGTLNRLVMDGDTLGHNGTLGGQSVLVEAQGTAVMKVTVQNSRFTGSRDQQFQLNMVGTGANDLVFTNNVLTNSHSNSLAGGVLVSGGGAGTNPTLTYNISNNNIQGAKASALIVSKPNTTGSYVGTIGSNIIGTAGVANSGSAGGSGISLIWAVQGTHSTSITNNQIFQYNNFGISLQTGGVAATGVTHNATLNATVTGNTIANPGTLGALDINGIYLNSGTNSGDAYQVCLGLNNNTLTGSGKDNGSGVGQDYYFRGRFVTTVRLPGYTGAADGSGLPGYLVPRTNGAFTTGYSSQSGTNFQNTAGGASCPTS